jgi:hypothetical protein
MKRLGALGVALALAMVSGVRGQVTGPTALPPGKMVTLSVKDRPFGEVLSELTKQTSVRLSASGPANAGKVTLDVQNRPLWEVVISAMDQARVTGEVNLSVPDVGGPVINPVCAAGPFLISAEIVQHDVDFRRLSDDTDRARLGIGVRSDMSVRVLCVMSDTMPTKAEDAEGNSWLPTKSSPLVPAYQPGNPRFAARIVMQPPAGKFREKVRFSVAGEIPVLLGEYEAVELGAGQDLTRDVEGFAMSVNWNAASSPPEISSAYVTAHFKRPGGMTDEDWRQACIRLGAANLALADGAGKRWVESIVERVPARPAIRADSLEIRRDFRRTVAVPTARDQVPGDAAKATVSIPVRTRWVMVPYHFENVEIP